MTVPDLLKRFIELQIPKNKEIYVDSARPDVVEDLRRAGYNAKLANKAVNDVIIEVSKLVSFNCSYIHFYIEFLDPFKLPYLFSQSYHLPILTT